MNTTIIRETNGLVTVSIPTMSGNVVTRVNETGSNVEDFLLGSLQHPSVRLTRELRLKVRKAAGSGVTIEWPEAELAVQAPNFQDAINRFRRALAEAFLKHSSSGAIPAILANALREGRA